MTTESELDLSNLLSPVVSLDTNVIRSVKENSPPFQLLVELAKAKSVRVIIPEMVIEERRTQWREQHLKNVNDAIKALSALRNEKVVANELSQEFDAALKSLEGLDADALSIVRYNEFLEDNYFQSKALTIEESNLAWEGYFSGKPPFKEVKNRADIPDAHILATVQSIAKNAPESYFVAGDKAMLSAAKSLNHINAYATIDELISSARFIELRDELEVEKKWKKLKSLVSDIGIQQHVAKFTYDYGDEMLDWKEVRDPSIPEDNHTAVIHSNGTPSTVSVGKVEDWGGGFLRCPVTFNVQANLSFMVYRGDAFDVPDWVSVSFGDLEKEQYFEAEGYREIIVNADVSIKIDLDALSCSGEGEVFEIAFEEASVVLSLSEDQ